MSDWIEKFVNFSGMCALAGLMLLFWGMVIGFIVTIIVAVTV